MDASLIIPVAIWDDRMFRKLSKWVGFSFGFYIKKLSQGVNSLFVDLAKGILQKMKTMGQNKLWLLGYCKLSLWF